APGLPNPDKLRAQFEARVGKVYIFRGVTVTVLGDFKDENGQAAIQIPESKELLHLVPLVPEHKIEWNFKDQRPLNTKPEEQDAYKQLLDAGIFATAATLKSGLPSPKVRVTGL